MLATIEHNPALSTPQMGKLRKQAQELEGVFLNTLVKEMFSGIKTDSKSFGGGFAEDTWRGIQAEQYSSNMAASGGIGLADQVMESLVALQEAAQNPINNPIATPGAYK